MATLAKSNNGPTPEEIALAAQRAAEEQLRAQYRALKGQLEGVSGKISSVVGAANSLYSIMKANMDIDGKIIKEAEINGIKSGSAAAKSSIDGIISSIAGKC